MSIEVCTPAAQPAEQEEPWIDYEPVFLTLSSIEAEMRLVEVWDVDYGRHIDTLSLRRQFISSCNYMTAQFGVVRLHLQARKDELATIHQHIARKPVEQARFNQHVAEAERVLALAQQAVACFKIAVVTRDGSSADEGVAQAERQVLTLHNLCALEVIAAPPSQPQAQAQQRCCVIL